MYNSLERLGTTDILSMHARNRGYCFKMQTYLKYITATMEQEAAGKRSRSVE